MQSWRTLLERLHRDERGAVSLETILIVAAIALPILTFLIKYGWPRIRDNYFHDNMDRLQDAADRASR